VAACGRREQGAESRERERLRRATAPRDSKQQTAENGRARGVRAPGTGSGGQRARAAAAGDRTSPQQTANSRERTCPRRAGAFARSGTSSSSSRGGSSYRIAISRSTALATAWRMVMSAMRG